MGIIANRLSAIKPSQTIAISAGRAPSPPKARTSSASAPVSPFRHAGSRHRGGDRRHARRRNSIHRPRRHPGIEGGGGPKFKRDNTDYAPSQVSIATGGKQILYNALMASLDEGDEVVIPAPYWVSYPDMVLPAGGTPVIVPCSQENRSFFSPPISKRRSRRKPNGLSSTARRSDRRRLHPRRSETYHRCADAIPMWVMTDDMYEHLVYDDFKFCAGRGRARAL